MTSCIVLAAGLSSRFGSPKALAIINGTPAITKLLRSISASRIDEIIVVLGADRDVIQQNLFKHKLIRVVYNNDYKFGQTSSVQTGLKALSSHADGIMMIPVDCPFIQTHTIDTLIDHYKRNNPQILIPMYKSRKGHPPIFNRYLIKNILTLTHEEGLNKITQNPAHNAEMLELPDPGITQTFNTPDELARILNTPGF